MPNDNFPNPNITLLKETLLGNKIKYIKNILKETEGFNYFEYEKIMNMATGKHIYRLIRNNKSDRKSTEQIVHDFDSIDNIDSFVEGVLYMLDFKITFQGLIKMGINEQNN